jgi:predicted AAA+ superfamily ATPase
MFSYQMANQQYPRSLKSILERDLALYPVVAVMGARQVGKSTLCRQVADEHGLDYRTLDDRETLDHARRDPEGLLRELEGRGCFIDEAQRAPGLFLAIKAVVDQQQRPGRYLLSGSNQPRVSSAVSDSLLGRVAYRTLRPLTLSELRFDDAHPGWSFLFGDRDDMVLRELERRADAGGQLDWQDVVCTGGFPRAVAALPEHRLQMLDDYVQVFASRDIREVIGLDSSDRFEPFLRLTATRSGQPLNASGLAVDLGVPVSTIRRWIEALQRSYLIELVPPYSRNAGQRVIKAPKLFAVDAAFALAAARETSPSGFHLENLVATDLAVWKDGGTGRAVYHWRLAGGQEVDFVLEEKGRLLPVEVKSSSSVGRSETKHLRTFRERHANAPRALLLSSDPLIHMPAPGIVAAPWWAVL